MQGTFVVIVYWQFLLDSALIVCTLQRSWGKRWEAGWGGSVSVVYVGGRGGGIVCVLTSVPRAVNFCCRAAQPRQTAQLVIVCLGCNTT